jgi:hypothetical protein
MGHSHVILPSLVDAPQNAGRGLIGRGTST